MPRSLRDLVQQSAQPVVLAIGFAFLVVISAGSIALLYRTNANASLVEHALAVSNRLQQLRLEVRNAESSAHGFLLTGETSYRTEFARSVGRVLPASGALADMLAENAPQARALAALRPLLRRWADDLQETVAVSAGGDRAAALGRLDDGRVLLARIETSMQRMAAEEQALLGQRRASSVASERVLLIVNLIGAALIVGLAILSILLLRRTNRERETTLRGLVRTNADLEAIVAARTTNLREAFVELQRSADILHNTIDSMADAVIVADPNGKVLISNPAARRMFGKLPDANSPEWRVNVERFEADGVTPLPPEDAPVQRVLRGEQVSDMAFVQRRPGATKAMHIVASGRPMRDAEGAPAGAVVVYHDVTDLQETERQLRHVQKMDAVGQLTGGIAHDFNNSLTVILGTIELLIEGVADRPHLVVIARMIDEAAGRGAELTRQLLAFARMQPLQPGIVNINELITGAGRLLRPTLGEHVDIAVRPDEDAWPVLADASQLTNAVINLALNARDAMAGGGRLTIETGNVVLDEAYAHDNPGVQPGPYAIIAVSDDGAGIPEELRDRIFEPFFTTKPAGKGTGLGLSMVYGFVKQSNGHLKVYSEVGAGTTMKIFLPRAEPAALAAPEPAIPAPEGGSESILLVEDDDLVRAFASTQLKGMGYTIHAASGSAEALALIEGGIRCDLLLTDVILPGAYNGVQLAEQAVARRPALRVLYTSGYTESAMNHQGRLPPDALLLPKPFRRAELAEMVREALSADHRSAVHRPRRVTDLPRGTGTMG